MTWMAGMAVVASRCCGDPRRVRKTGYEKFLAAVRRELPRWGGKLVRHAVVRGLWDALADTAGVAAQRPGALERLRMLLEDWRDLRGRLAATEELLAAALEDLGLAQLVASIPGVSVLSGALILAECGDPRRFSCARALVKHAGLNPSENTSATINGQSRVSRRGRPALRCAAWRAAWGAMPRNDVLRARHAHLTGRDAGRLADGQARAACAATLLRWIWAITTSGRPWDAAIASGQATARPAAAAA